MYDCHMIKQTPWLHNVATVWLSHDQADTLATQCSHCMTVTWSSRHHGATQCSHCMTVTWLSLFEIRNSTFYISNSSSTAALWPPESHCWVPTCQPSKSYLQSATPTIVLWPCPHTKLFPGENGSTHTTPSHRLLYFSCSGADSEGDWLCTGGKEDMGENAIWDEVHVHMEVGLHEMELRWHEEVLQGIARLPNYPFSIPS